VRHKPESLLIAVMSAFAAAALVANALDDSAAPAVTIDPILAPAGQPTGDPNDASAWFRSMRQHCNPVEVETQMRWQPAPPTPEGRMHEAACYALAGKIELARASIEALAADAGDDLAAGPLMELVVEFWPNHYMALYHAGAARYENGSNEAAQKYLEQFLVEYSAEDGWRSSAISMLEEIERQ
jgi:hypothetical protein